MCHGDEQNDRRGCTQVEIGGIGGSIRGYDVNNISSKVTKKSIEGLSRLTHLV